jgi:5-methylcytosine-specific restriction enzyme B
MIPPNLDRNHVLSALREIDANPAPASRESVDYRLEHEGRSYPPKYVVSVANRFANGTDLDPATFSAGEAETNPLLRRLGFTVSKVTENAATGAATTFAALKQAVLKDGHHFQSETLSHYLLALQTKRFAILSGVSGTGKTRLAIAVAEHFPAVLRERVAQSLPPDTVQVKVEPYMLKYQRVVVPVALAPRIKAADDDRVLVRFPGGEEMLLCKPYVTKAVLLMLRGAARAWFLKNLKVGDVFGIRAFEGEGDAPTVLELLPLVDRLEVRRVPNSCVVAVRPDWTDHRALLGYFNPLRKRYETTPFLRFLLEARDECARAVAEARPPAPFFAVFDEMNLARVEHYFSDFLSCMESGEPLQLHDDADLESVDGVDDAEVLEIPRALRLPPNVFFTGTVNVDETTYLFSPKVLDRAFVLELNEVDLVGYGAAAIEDVGLALPGFGSFDSNEKPSPKHWRELDAESRAAVIRLEGALVKEGRPFGYQVANEIARFLQLAGLQSGADPEARLAALDLAIRSKILPKLNGTQQELKTTLAVLAGFFGDEKLARCGAKVARMQARLASQGFTSFIE